MFSIFPFIFIFLVVLFLIKRWKHPRMKKNYPPGPPKLPLLGSLPFLGKDLNEGYSKMADKYGKTFSVQLGPDDVIVSSDFDIINKVLKDKRMAGRISFGKLDSLRYGDYRHSVKPKGILFSEGNEWSEQRRFTLQHLRDFGFGKSSMSEMIYEEVTKLKNGLRKDLGKSIDLNLLFNISVVNSLWRIITGEAFALDDPTLKKIVTQVDRLLKMKDLSAATFLLPPWIVDLLPERPLGIPQTVSLFDDMKALIKTYITDHEENHDSDSMNDFMDIYIEQIKSAKDTSSSFFGDTGNKNMMCSFIDLFIAGSETTSSNLLWIFFFLCQDPDIQAKLRKEIEDVVGSRSVELEDRPNLPYVEAVISEVHRYASLVATGVPHRALEDMEVDGFLFPSGTIFMTHVFGVHHDVDYWTNPYDFKPERFIDQEGKFHTDPRLIPFMVGKRFCLGQSLAQNELFMFLTLLIQDFTFSFPPGYSPPTIKKFGNVTLFGLNAVPPYLIVMQPV